MLRPPHYNCTVPIMLKTAIINSFLVWRNVDVTFVFITNLQFTFKLLLRKWKQGQTLETNKNTKSRIYILITFKACQALVSYSG